MSEWVNPDGSEKRGRDLPYRVVPVRCPACELVQDAEATLRAEKDPPKGIHLAFEPTGATARPDA